MVLALPLFLQDVTDQRRLYERVVQVEAQTQKLVNIEPRQQHTQHKVP
jgi:hypothetical protein